MVKGLEMSTFIENDIRPADSMDGQKVAFLDDLGKLLAKYSEFVDVPCPACKSDGSKKAFEKYGLCYVQCNCCDTVYITPRPTEELLHNLYSRSTLYAYWNSHIFPASDTGRRRHIARPRVDNILRLCDSFRIGTGSLLEVGAGYGTFCEAVKERKLFETVIALEPTPALAATCMGKGIETVNQFFELYDPDKKFNVIAAFEVIEHLFSPESFVKKCCSLLDEKGLLVLTCPNVKGFDFKTLGHLCGNYDHEHLNYFNPRSLSQLLLRCGFEIIDLATPGSLDAELVRSRIIDGGIDVSTQPFLKQVLIDEWDRVGKNFQQFIADNMLSSSLWIAAKKVTQRPGDKIT
jgi:2-polyprenyl-3-methyl-5-hydroxy-6-metoxy-1,4-benzoquinol methylase